MTHRPGADGDTVQARNGRKTGGSLSRWQARGILVLFALIALTCGTFISQKYWAAFRATLFTLRTWEVATATVEEAHLEIRDVRDSLSARGGRGPREVYRPKITYRYRFEGSEYTSDRYSLVDLATNDERAQRAKLSEFPVGRSITVYVNPKSPDEAVIDKNETKGVAIMAAAGLAFIAVGIGLLAALLLV